MMGVGSILAGAGGFLGSLFGGDGPAQIDPEIQAALAAGKLDIGEFTANLAAAKLGWDLPFQQDMQAYPLSLQKALQKTFTDNFGSLEFGARDFAEASLSGKPSKITQNLLNAQNAQGAQDRLRADQDVENMIAQKGLAPDSPLAEEMRRQNSRHIDTSLRQEGSNLLAQRSQFELPYAMQYLENIRNATRIAGAETPDVPLTGQGRRDQEISDIDRQIAELKSGSPFASKFSPKLRELESQRNLLSQSPFGTVQHPTTRNVPRWEMEGQTLEERRTEEVMDAIAARQTSGRRA
jgi:hypothetical protein